MRVCEQVICMLVLNELDAQSKIKLKMHREKGWESVWDRQLFHTHEHGTSWQTRAHPHASVNQLELCSTIDGPRSHPPGDSLREIALVMQIRKVPLCEYWSGHAYHSAGVWIRAGRLVWCSLKKSRVRGRGWRVGSRQDQNKSIVMQKISGMCV